MSSAVRAPLGGALLGSAGVAVIGVLALACEPEHWEEGATLCGQFDIPDSGSAGDPATPEWVEFWPGFRQVMYCRGTIGEDSSDPWAVAPWDEPGAVAIEVVPVNGEGYFSGHLDVAGSTHSAKWAGDACWFDMHVGGDCAPLQLR